MWDDTTSHTSYAAFTARQRTPVPLVCMGSSASLRSKVTRGRPTFPHRTELSSAQRGEAPRRTHAQVKSAVRPNLVAGALRPPHMGPHACFPPTVHCAGLQPPRFQRCLHWAQAQRWQALAVRRGQAGWRRSRCNRSAAGKGQPARTSSSLCCRVDGTSWRGRTMMLSQD